MSYLLSHYYQPVATLQKNQMIKPKLTFTFFIKEAYSLMLPGFGWYLFHSYYALPVSRSNTKMITIVMLIIANFDRRHTWASSCAIYFANVLLIYWSQHHCLNMPCFLSYTWYADTHQNYILLVGLTLIKEVVSHRNVKSNTHVLSHTNLSNALFSCPYTQLPLADLVFELIMASSSYNPSASNLAYLDSCLLPSDLLGLASVCSVTKLEFICTWELIEGLSIIWIWSRFYPLE